MTGFWKNKKVLITGADGFIGSHLTERLVKEGANVRAYVYYNSFGKKGWLDKESCDVCQDIEIFQGDIRDPHRVLEAVKEVDVVFHLASLIGIPYSYQAPDSYVQTNINGTLNVLNACRERGVTRLIHTSTSEVYGSARYIPIDESHPLQGQSPYAATKIGAEKLVESYYCSFELPVSIIRPFNTYGPRQSTRAVIPTIISQILNQSEEIHMGSFLPTRDFNFVLDTVAGFLAIAECDQNIGQVTNLGSGREASIEELVKIIVRLANYNGKIVSDENRLRPEKSEVDRLVCDSTKARELTGWKPKHTLEEGLGITMKWMASRVNKFSHKEYAV